MVDVIHDNVHSMLPNGNRIQLGCCKEYQSVIGTWYCISILNQHLLNQYVIFLNFVSS